MTIENPIVLVVDDCNSDALLMRLAFERAGLQKPLAIATDGEAAISYLRGDGGYSDRTKFPLPSVVLLDLIMSRKNGFEVLALIRLQSALTGLRVYILSASSRADDIRRAYDLGANSYLVKPSTLDELMFMAKTLVAWLGLTQFVPAIEAPRPARAPRSRWLRLPGGTRSVRSPR